MVRSSVLHEDTRKNKESLDNLRQEFADLSMEELFEDELLQIVLTVVQDGICFLSTDLDVLYLNPAMRYWYGGKQNAIGEKCYVKFHWLDHPCDHCPAKTVLQEKQPASGEQFYEVGDRREGWQHVFCAPVLNPDGNVQLVIEYVRDITGEKKSAISMELIQAQLQSVIEIMEQNEAERRSREQKLLGNMNKSIDTVGNYLEKILDKKSFDIIRRQLELARYGIDRDLEPAVRLSGQELAIARFIAKGYLSKEIASELNISKKTVDYHRTNLRKKVELDKGDSLREILQDYFVKNGI